MRQATIILLGGLLLFVAAVWCSGYSEAWDRRVALLSASALVLLGSHYLVRSFPAAVAFAGTCTAVILHAAGAVQMAGFTELGLGALTAEWLGGLGIALAVGAPFRLFRGRSADSCPCVAHCLGSPIGQFAGGFLAALVICLIAIDFVQDRTFKIWQSSAGSNSYVTLLTVTDRSTLCLAHGGLCSSCLDHIFAVVWQGQVPTWVACAVLAAYPFVALLEGPFRRWGRWRSRRCPTCGYDLTGNESGTCPECGTEVKA